MSVTVKALVVGGGASGGVSDTSNGGAGGGGAGGYAYDPTHIVAPGSYSITIGLGGATKTGAGNNGASGNNGSDTIFDTITAKGGGGGGGSNSNNAQQGGSGGGGGNYNAGATALGSQGFAGGSSANNDGRFDGAGGGGSSAVGGDTINTAGGAGQGGAGTSNSISGSPVTYATGGSGGVNGGGSKVDGVNPGDGGNGNNYNTGPGAGYKGIVVIAYPINGSTGVSTDSTGGTITQSGGYQIHTFTTDGTFVMSPFVLSTGVFTLTGNSINASKGFTALLSVGSFILSGIALARNRIFGQPWNNQNKNNSNWTNQNKS